MTSTFPQILYLTLLPAIALIASPFAGILTRYRAVYSPIYQTQSRTEVTLTGRSQKYRYYSLMRRVYQIEGLLGIISKGLVPRALEWLLAFVVVVICAFIPTDRARAITITKPQVLFYMASPSFPAQYLPLLLVSPIFVGLPFHVLIVRATTTKYILSYRKPILSLKFLLSPAERRHPWRLYTIPGLFLGFVLQTMIPVGLTNLSGRLMYPHLNMKTNAMDILLAQLAVTIGAKLLCVPLYVANTRLAMAGQCPTRYVGEEQEQALRRRWDVQEAEESGVPMYCREEEDPIVYRGDRNIAEPYVGLVHCLGTIVREEGLSTLFRGWLLSLARMFIYA